MSRIELDQRRRLLVERQMLGSTGRHGRGIADVAEALSLLHSTDPATPYLMLHARTDADTAEIDAAFYDDRSLVRHTCIRRTIFAMPHEAALAAHGAVNVPLVGKLRSQLVGWLDASDDVDGDATEFLGRAEAGVLGHLAADGAATGTQLAGAVDELRVRFDPMPGKSYSKPQRITSKVLEIMAAEGRIARARPTGIDLTSGSWTWAATQDWFGDRVDFDRAPGAADALVDLLGRYLRAFGPATVTDMTWWTGLTKTKVRVALATFDAVEVEMHGADEPGYVRRDDDLAAVDEAADPVVALLPGLDSTTMGWKQRSWYVDDSVATGLFDRNGNAGPTVWVDGRVVGAWTQGADGAIRWTLLDRVGSTAEDAIAVEAERTTAWLGDVRVNWRYPTPLTKALAS